MKDKILEFLTELANTNIDLMKIKEETGNTCIKNLCFSLIFNIY